MKRYSVSEWFDFGGGGDIFWTDSLEDAKEYISDLCKSDCLFVSYSLYDNEERRVINGP